MPDLRDQLLITSAQGRLLVCAHQASTLQEELGERGAGGGGREPGQQRREGARGIVYNSWLEKEVSCVGIYQGPPEP